MNKTLSFILLLMVVSGIYMATLDKQPKNTLHTPEVSPLVTPTPVPTPTKVDDVFMNEYMKGCNSSGKLEDYCSCTYTYMINKVGRNNLLKESIEYSKTGVISKLMSESVEACFDKI